MRISSIDIGSNAIRQLVVEVLPDGSWKVLKKHRETIRLGSDVFTLGEIRNTTLTRLIAAFKRMDKNNKKYKVDRSLAFATSAFRDARNKKPILSAIYRHSHIKIKISGFLERVEHPVFAAATQAKQQGIDYSRISRRASAFL